MSVPDSVQRQLRVAARALGRQGLAHAYGHCSVRLSEAPSYGLTILEYDPNSRGAIAYSSLSQEVAARTASQLEGLSYAQA